MPIANELTINTSASAMDMANAIFGNGITVTDASFEGALGVQSGIYSGATTTLAGMTNSDTGVILSTGNVQDFTNSSGSTDTNVNTGTGMDVTGGIDGDAGLNSIAGVSTFDGAILNATFIPDGDMLTMSFVFSSEEYPEYVNGGVNDAFGVWVNGTFVPVTITVAGNVSIDSVNGRVNENLYRDNTADQFNTEMDGFTYVLSITAPVNSGVENTIRIGIADGGDQIYDSNLLIMGESAQTYALAIDDDINILTNSTRTFDILANDEHRDGATLTITQINGQDIVAGQTITLASGQQVRLNADGTITVFSNGTVGQENFSYTIIDSQGNQDVGFVTLNTVTTMPLDGIVSGTGGDDLIDGSYLGDPDGDRVDANDGRGVRGTTGNADLIYAGAGNDTVLAGDGNDIVDGGAGNDSLDGGIGDDTLTGGLGNDTIYGGTGRDSLEGEAGDDSLLGQEGDDTLLGGEGNDMLDGGADNDQLDGGLGDDQLFGGVSTGSDTIYGGEGNDTITDYLGNDVIYAGAGDDLAYGGGDADALYGEDGNDDLRGAVGLDTLYGGTGSDSLYGGGDSDQLYGGDGNDLLHTGPGNDTAYGGQGSDTFILDDGHGVNVFTGGEDAGDTDIDVVDGSAHSGNTTVVFTGNEAGTIAAGSDSATFSEIEAVTTGAGDDTIDASATTGGVVVNSSGDGADVLIGGSGNDVFATGAGADTVTGGLGDDLYELGAGDGTPDLVVFGDGHGADTIQGFDVPVDNGNGTFTGVDLLDVSGLTDANGAIVNTGDVVVTDDGNGNALLTFPGGESITLAGVSPTLANNPAWLAAIGIPAPNYIVEGTAGDDTIDGSYLGDPQGDLVDASDNQIGTNDDVIQAGAGNDSVVGGGGNDIIYGGEGNDTVWADDATSTGNDLVYGGAGDDTLTGGLGNDTLYGDEGNDTLSGSEGDDSLIGGAGDDSLRGAMGNDQLQGNDGNDTLDGGSGDDTISGGAGDDSVLAGSGNDVIDLGAGNDFVDASVGNDSVQGGAGSDTISGASGDDTLDGGAGGDSVFGGIGNDSLDGGFGNDTLSGDDGNDSIAAGAGNDSVAGGTGNDTIEGHGGSDTVDGGDGDDVIFGGGDPATVPAGLTVWANDPNSIYRIDIADDGTAVRTLVGPAARAYGDIGMDDTGTLYGVAGGQLYRIDTATGAETPMGAIGNGAGGNALSFGPDGTAYGAAGNSIYQFDPTNPGTSTLWWTDPAGGYPAGDFLFVGDKAYVSWVSPSLGQTQLLELGLDGDGNVVSQQALGVLPGTSWGLAAGANGEIYTVANAQGANALHEVTIPDSPLAGGTGLLTTTLVDGTQNGGNNYWGATSNFEAQLGDGADLGDSLSGGAGNDTIYGNHGEDTISGGADNDLIYGGEDNDTLRGDAGNDTLVGGEGDDSLAGGDGDDSLNGGVGNDTIFGNAGSDTVDAGDGDDVINTRTDPGLGVPDSGLIHPTNPALSYPADTDPNNDRDLVYAGAGNDTILTGDDDDTIFGGSGSDRIDAGFDDDSVEGGVGNDTIEGNEGADTLYGGEGDDLIRGGLDPSNPDYVASTNYDLTDDIDPNPDNNRDLVFGGDGNDSIYGQDDSDTLYGGTGNDLLDGGIDNDALAGGAGDDTLYGDHGDDYLDGGEGNDTLYGGIGNDQLSDGDSGDDLIFGGDGNDTISANSGNDTLNGEAGDDWISATSTSGVVTVSGGSGNDSIYGGWTDGPVGDQLSGDEGDDRLYGNGGNDTIYGGTGNDFVDAGDDIDLVYGEAGNDYLDGALGDDTLYGGSGNDTLLGGDGADSLSGGDDRDTFTNLGIGDVVDGNEGGDDYDTLDLQNWGKDLTNIIYDPTNRENGTVEFLDTDGYVIGTMTFSNIENVIPCFTPGSLIVTARGEVAVERLRVGDMILTRDNGYQPLRWVGSRSLSAADLLAQPSFAPVRIAAGALGGNLPERDMMVSPQHRMLVTSTRSEMFFGEREVLVAAVHMVGQTGISRVHPEGVTYIHVLFDTHEVIRADGAWTESFQPGDLTLAGMDDAQRNEVLALFPELQQGEGFAAARRSLKAHEAKVLLMA